MVDERVVVVWRELTWLVLANFVFVSKGDMGGGGDYGGGDFGGGDFGGGDFGGGDFGD